MKLYGIAGKGTGKVGSMVYAISGGEQIVRQYNPIVANPNTERQVEQRAKFKLITQIAAAVAPAIAFKKDGLRSARNQFIARNLQFISFGDGKAELRSDEMQLTPSTTPLARISASNADDTTVSVSLRVNSAALVDRVVYHSFAMGENGALELIGSAIANEPGDDGLFAASVPRGQGAGSAATLVLAYGVKDNNAAATLKYTEFYTDSNIFVNAVDVSKLFATSDFSLTATVGDIVDGLE